LTILTPVIDLIDIYNLE